MKKILFLLVLIYNYSFSSMILTDASDWQSRKSSINAPCNTSISTYDNSNGSSGTYYYYEQYNRLQYQKVIGTGGPTGTTTLINYTCGNSGTGAPICSNKIDTNGIMVCKDSNDVDPEYVKNPDPLGGGQCRDLFQKEGQAYTCNPNTNEATPIPNSNGTIADPETGADKPNCNDGYSYTNMPNMSANGSTTGYYTHSCIVDTPTPPTGGTGTGGTGEPSISYGGDGSVTMTLPDGTKQTTYGDGWVTTTYPDGSTSSTPPRTGGSGGSSGGSGTSGGGTGGTSGNTTNENNTTPPTDTPIDNTPVANACTDSALTLQERMLCELNAGMKKQNSEGAPQNSLNQLLKDLKTSNQTDNTAINTNLKDVVSGTTQLVNKQTQANATLEKINDSANASELYNKVTNEGINKISGTLDGIAEFVTTISDFVKNPSQIGDLMNNKLGEVANKYQTGIMNDSSCGVCPTIFIPYHGTNVTLLNQTLLDTYFPIAMMKTIIILTFAFAGFMNFFRSSN